MKCLLYCTIALPWLYQGADGKWYVTKSKCAQVGCKPARNGYVSFECDCKEAFEFVQYEQDEIYLPVAEKLDEIMTPDGLSNQSCLTPEQLKAYGKGKDLYAYHFENVKPIDPMPITQLYRDGTMVYPLTRAPQSYCFLLFSKCSCNNRASSSILRCRIRTSSFVARLNIVLPQQFFQTLS